MKVSQQIIFLIAANCEWPVAATLVVVVVLQGQRRRYHHSDLEPTEQANPKSAEPLGKLAQEQVGQGVSTNLYLQSFPACFG